MKSPRSSVASAFASMLSFLICASAMIRFFAGCETTILATPSVSSSISCSVAQIQHASMTSSLTSPPDA